MDNPALISAWATIAIALVIGVAAGATCFLIWRGILEMRRSSNERKEDRQEAREADLRRHEEAMDEGLRRHDESMTALRALIARTAPPGTLGQAD